ncbi:hypothetical protein HE1_00030 [Holospora elegans E1]|uniref:Uncharacterized protein n=1 Tax=Holospora elegans E1 TaxID=1427503 RepID=A0A023DWN6_9PROT|nr:hypothetical protein [Holospora elegans]GAJ45721.1 hypothetical protein HE1_00030 [Holospora elegans E1]
MSALGKYYQYYVLRKFNIDKYTPDPHWRDCTRYLAGFLMKVLLLKEWKEYDYPKDKWTDEFVEVARILGWIFEFGTDEFGRDIHDLTQEKISEGSDHYPNASLMGYVAEMTVMGDVIDSDVLECSGIFNDLFIGRRDSFEMYSEEYCTTEIYDPSMNWPLPRSRGGPPYGRRPYLQGQDPPRSQAVIWVPLPILRFAFFAKEVAVFGRPFEGMQKVAQEQLEELDGHFIHPEYFYILARVLELEDSAESRKALDILANNLFLGEKPLTQAWTQELEDAPWLR